MPTGKVMRTFVLCLIGMVSSLGLGGCTGLTDADSWYDYGHYDFARPGPAYGYGYGSSYRYLWPRYGYVPYRSDPWDRRWRRFDHDHHARRDDDRHEPDWQDHDERRRDERRDDGKGADDGWGGDQRKHGGGWRGPATDRPGIYRPDGWGSQQRPPGKRRIVEDQERGRKVQPVPRIIDQLEAQGYSRIEPKKRRGRTLTVTAEDKQGGKSVLVIDRQTGRLIERPQVRR